MVLAIVSTSPMPKADALAAILRVSRAACPDSPADVILYNPSTRSAIGLPTSLDIPDSDFLNKPRSAAVESVRFLILRKDDSNLEEAMMAFLPISSSAAADAPPRNVLPSDPNDLDILPISDSTLATAPMTSLMSAPNLKSSFAIAMSEVYVCVYFFTFFFLSCSSLRTLIMSFCLAID